jgi:hypothetical protein
MLLASEWAPQLQLGVPISYPELHDLVLREARDNPDFDDAYLLDPMMNVMMNPELTKAMVEPLEQRRSAVATAVERVAAKINVPRVGRTLGKAIDWSAAHYRPIGAAACAVLAAPIAFADQFAPIGGASVDGAQGSEWHDTQLFRDVSGDGVQGVLYAVPRSTKGTENPGFDPATSAGIPVSIPPGATLTVVDAYQQIIGAEGAGALWFVPDAGSAEPLWRSRMFNQEGDAQNGMTMTPVNPETAYHGPGTVLRDVLSPATDRDSVMLVSGPDGVAGTWVYSNGAGGNPVEIPDTLGGNKTKQYTGGVRQLLGFEPEAGGQLDFVIEDGSATALISRTNNVSNDSALNEFAAYEAPSAYDISVKIYVSELGVPRVFAETSPSEDIIRRVWNVNNLDALIGDGVYACSEPGGSAVSSLQEVIHNYNLALDPEQQVMFSGDRNGFRPFANDSDNDGLPCDEDEPDMQFVYRLELHLHPN